MSVQYAALILNKEKLKIAESSYGKDFKMQIKNILPQIFKNTINDRIEFEDFYLTYTRSKEIIYLCVSPKKIGEDRPRKFIESLINRLSNKDLDIFSQIEAQKKQKTLKELSLQDKFSKAIDTQINNFNSGFENSADNIREIQKDLNEVKIFMNKNLRTEADNIDLLREGLLKTSANIKDNAKELRKDAGKLEGDNRFCCKPWVIKLTITGGVILTMIITYLVVALVRCNSFIDAFCVGEQK